MMPMTPMGTVIFSKSKNLFLQSTEDCEELRCAGARSITDVSPLSSCASSAPCSSSASATLKTGSKNGSALGLAVGYSLLSNVFLFATALFAAYAFAALPGAPGMVPMIEVYPIVNTISAIPISLSGIGVREQLFETLLNTLYGTPKSLAVLISLCGFFLSVLWSLLGGVVYLFYRPSTAGVFSISEMEAQVGSVEEMVEESKS